MIAMCVCVSSSSSKHTLKFLPCLCFNLGLWTLLSVDRFSISSEAVYRLPISPLISFYLNHFKLSNRQTIHFIVNVCLSTQFNCILNIQNTPGPSDQSKGMRNATYPWNMNHPAFLPFDKIDKIEILGIIENNGHNFIGNCTGTSKFETNRYERWLFFCTMSLIIAFRMPWHNHKKTNIHRNEC